MMAADPSQTCYIPGHSDPGVMTDGELKREVLSGVGGIRRVLLNREVAERKRTRHLKVADMHISAVEDLSDTALQMNRGLPAERMVCGEIP